MFLFLQGVLTGAVRSETSVLYATLGETLGERAGITNLGMEGCMLMGACLGFVTMAHTDNLALSMMAAALAGGLSSLIHAFLVVTRRANQLASGLALMFFGLGVTGFIGRPYVGMKIRGLNELPIPYLSEIPFVGPILFTHDVLTYLTYLLTPLLWVFLFYTRWGLAVRAVGENRTVAYASGLRPSLIQYLAVFFGGMLAGLGGAHLSIAYTHMWVEGMTAGRGFIAVALVIFSMWHPLRGMLGTLLFGGAIAFQLQLQARGSRISPYILDMTPYLLTLAVLLLWGRTRKHAMPEGLKAVFEGVD
ncbi:MAG: ABC transporter permease [candidate division NC10 bacterium]|nr:ABC transporter permease [candidate division NC10 bacterium]